MFAPRLPRVAVAAALLWTLAACSGGSAPDRPENTAPAASPTATPTGTPEGVGAYVALGDSFVAGPGIDPQRTDAGLCQRSEQNWPALLAERLGSEEVTDLSCSGSTSADVRTTIASAPLDADTGLVTLGIGGNDSSLFTTLVSRCATDGPACADFTAPAQLRSILERTIDDVVATVRAVRDRAPRARVVLVGYLRIMPAQGTCDAVGIPAAQAARVASAERALGLALETAADDAGVDFVSAYEAADGHDACAGDQSWTNGLAPVAGDGIFFHPNRRGMAGTATAVEDVVGRN